MSSGPVEDMGETALILELVLALFDMPDITHAHNPLTLNGGC